MKLWQNMSNLNKVRIVDTVLMSDSIGGFPVEIVTRVPILGGLTQALQRQAYTSKARGQHGKTKPTFRYYLVDEWLRGPEDLPHPIDKFHWMGVRGEEGPGFESQFDYRLLHLRPYAHIYS
jgi:hypothetical protein